MLPQRKPKEKGGGGGCGAGKAQPNPAPHVKPKPPPVPGIASTRKGMLATAAVMRGAPRMEVQAPAASISERMGINNAAGVAGAEAGDCCIPGGGGGAGREVLCSN